MKQTIEEYAKSYALACKKQEGINSTYDAYDAMEMRECAVIAGAKWEREQSPWISVNDELPPFEKYVLLWNKNINEVQTQYFEKGYDIRTFCYWYHLSYWRLADFPE